MFEKYPNMTIGVCVAKNLNNVGTENAISNLLKDAEQSALNEIADIVLSEHPKILPWRDAYRKFGVKPKKYQSSIENLLKRIRSGESIRHINKLVDIYNVISLEYLLPVGAEDMDKMRGDLELTVATENENPVTLLGEREARPPYEGEVIYKDSIGTVCRRWNWKEADRTKIEEKTENAIVVIEGLPPANKENILEAVTKLADLLKKFCDAEVTVTVLDSEQTELEL